MFDGAIRRSIVDMDRYIHCQRPSVGGRRPGAVPVRGIGVNSPPLAKNRWHILLACALTYGSAQAQVQADSSSIGGPETANPYSGGYEAGSSEGPHEALDGSLSIPGFELYGGFNTDVIFERIERARNESTTLELSTSACDHTFPVCGAINSRFGPRHGRMHYGVDIDLEHGDTIVSAFEGVVRVSRYHRQFGHVVVVRHANGIETLYGHMSERKVEVGDHVEAGDLIGLGGSTGRSSGNHLHFETRYLGQPIDPQLLFNVQEGELRTSTLRVHPGLFAVENRVKSSPQGIHVVRRGDTLSAIARRHRTSVSALCKKNRIRSTSTLRVGQRLRF